ncbi:MAG TPA: hypothetical protein VIZ69_01010 [Thermoanaerobaculia bacterium]
MNAIASLWLPIVVSAALVFLASTVSHTVLPFHKSDYAKLPGESEAMDLFRRLGVAPGDYLFPRPDTRKDLTDPAFREKYKKGPVGILTVMPNGGQPMGRTFLLWFFYCAAVSAFAAFVSTRAVPQDASPRSIFVLVAAASAGGYVLALWQSSIWYGKSWATTVKSSIDGVVYGLLTGGAFAWLWPR